MLCVFVSLVVQARGKGGRGGSHLGGGHVTKNGTYVAPHRSTNPKNTKRDNFSSKGNVNPYTGKEGTKDPNKVVRRLSFGSFVAAAYGGLVATAGIASAAIFVGSPGYPRGWTVNIEGEKACSDPFIWTATNEIECS